VQNVSGDVDNLAGQEVHQPNLLSLEGPDNQVEVDNAGSQHLSKDSQRPPYFKKRGQFRNYPDEGLFGTNETLVVPIGKNQREFQDGFQKEQIMDQQSGLVTAGNDSDHQEYGDKNVRAAAGNLEALVEEQKVQEEKIQEKITVSDQHVTASMSPEMSKAFVEDQKVQGEKLLEQITEGHQQVTGSMSVEMSQEVLQLKSQETVPQLVSTIPITPVEDHVTIPTLMPQESSPEIPQQLLQETGRNPVNSTLIMPSDNVQESPGQNPEQQESVRHQEVKELGQEETQFPLSKDEQQSFGDQEQSTTLEWKISVIHPSGKNNEESNLEQIPNEGHHRQFTGGKRGRRKGRRRPHASGRPIRALHSSDLQEMPNQDAAMQSNVVNNNEASAIASQADGTTALLSNVVNDNPIIQSEGAQQDSIGQLDLIPGNLQGAPQ